MRRVVLHIDRVVVRGVAIRDPYAFETGLLSELRNAFERLDGEALMCGAPQAQCTHGKVFMPRSSGAHETGRRVAHGIAGALRR